MALAATNDSSPMSIQSQKTNSVQMSQIGLPQPVAPSPEIFYDDQYQVNKDPRVIEQRNQHDDVIS